MRERWLCSHPGIHGQGVREMALRLFPAAHCDSQQAQVVGGSTVAGGSWANYQCIAVMRQEALVEHCRTAGIAEEGAHLGEIHETGNPAGISGNVSEVMRGEMLKLCPRLLFEAKFTIDQR